MYHYCILSGTEWTEIELTRQLPVCADVLSSVADGTHAMNNKKGNAQVEGTYMCLRVNIFGLENQEVLLTLSVGLQG